MDNTHPKFLFSRNGILKFARIALRGNCSLTEVRNQEPTLTYVLKEKLHEGSETVIYRAIRTSDHQPVIIKTTRSEHPSPEKLASLQHEYSILRELELKGVIRAYGLESQKNRLSLILEDFGGQPLSKLARAQRFTLETVLEIAIAVAGTVEQLHAHPILHKDLKPHNILLNTATRQLKLIDFSVATRLSRESQRAVSPTTLEGTLAYMSPEQTGRMNRVVDPRSDLYSLGVTLYELLTGTLPFHATDPREMIHSHIARQPLPPRQRDQSVPQVLSDIVMKLLAKAAEDRYQSAHGLRLDLQECLQRLRASGKITDFPIGRHDHDGELRIPQRLYGREAESAALLASFDRTSRGAVEIILLSGYAGVGKSTLAQEIYKGIAQRGGYFISGKFDQLGHHVPYAPMARAFGDLIRQLLTEPPAILDAWKQKLLAALGGNGPLLTSLIPELALVIGPQPGVPELGPTESKNRFSLVFQNFLRVFSTSEHPLVLFLDDLQWADPASLKLLQILLSDPELGHLQLIGAYRDQEVDALHPLAVTLGELRKAGSRIEEYNLKPLGLMHVAQLLVATLGCNQERIAPLAQLVFHKTQGNPFFVNQFLSALHKERLLAYDSRAGVWEWDLQRIAEAQVTDNVVDFMAAKLRRLSPATQRLLMVASCIGHRFEIGALAALYDKTPAEIADPLWQAMQEGLIVPLGSQYRFLASGGESGPSPLHGTADQAAHVACRFLHDRVQQAAYALIPESEKQQLHLRIGQRLKAQHQSSQVEDELFELVNHLNYAAPLISAAQECIELARLNYRASTRARAATAYATAASYCRAGIALLPQGSWDAEHELTFGLHAVRAECEYLSGQFQEAEALFQLLLAHTHSVFEQVHVHSLRMVMYITQGLFADAIDAGRIGLRLFGIDLPEQEAEQQAALAAAHERMQVSRAGRSMAALLDAPAMTSPQQHAISKLYMELVAPAYFTSPTLFSLITARMVHLSLEYGNSELSPYGYLAHGFLLAAAMGQPAEAYEFGQLGLALHEKYHSSSLTCRLNFLFGIYQHLCRPLRTAVPCLMKAVHSGLQTGDLTYASFACHHLGFTRLGLGDELGAVREEVDRFLALMHKTQDMVSLRTLTITRQAIACLQGRTSDVLTLNDERFDEQEFVAAAQAAKFPMGCCYFYFTKLQLLYIYGDYPGARAMAEQAEALQWSAFGLYYRTELPLYICLTLAACYPAAAAAEQVRYLAAMQRHHAQIGEWTKGCPENFQHHQLLVAAELARLSHNEAEAIGLYEQAIAVAQQSGFVHLAAIACELAAKLHLSRQRLQLAGLYFREAKYCYGRWGATAKVRQLVEQYPELTSDPAELPLGTVNAATVSSSSAHAAGLDVATLIGAAQAIAGEMVHAQVLTQLMRSVLTNSGAQRGFLLIPGLDGLTIEAAMYTDPDSIEVGLATPMAADARLATTIVHYVARSRETVVLGNARSESRFAADPYIAAEQPKSILCLALLHREHLPGILYLENNATFDAFTKERVELLRFLSSQAAIAMENARLYTDVQQASRELQRANEELETQVCQRTEELRGATDLLRGTNEALMQRTEELRQANQLLQKELAERERSEKARAALQEEIITVQSARLAEMSTPLIPITDRIVVMPLIGTMDAARAQQVLETALSGTQRHSAQVVILDITGMTHMDTSVAGTLLNTARALRLLGADAVLTGIRAEFAQLLVTLGIDLAGLVTRSTLQSGIAYALNRTRESERS